MNQLPEDRPTEEAGEELQMGEEAAAQLRMEAEEEVSTRRLAEQGYHPPVELAEQHTTIDNTGYMPDIPRTRHRDQRHHNIGHIAQRSHWQMQRHLKLWRVTRSQPPGW